MATYSNSAREVEMPDGNVVVLHSEPTGGANSTSNIKKFTYDDNGHVTASSPADAEDLNLDSYSTPTTGTTAIGTSDSVQTAIGKLDHQSQIDQTNILYVLGKTGKNLLDISDFKSYESNVGTWSGNTFTPTSAPNITFTINSDYTVTVNGSTPSGTAVTFIISANKGIKAGSYVLSGCPSGGSQTTFDLRYYRQSTGAITADTGNSANITIDDGAYNVAILIRGGQTVSSKVFKPMVCTPEDWAVGHDFAPYALPNSDLTGLEAEDRAALAEEIDAGAKNILQQLSEIADSGFTITRNSDTSINIKGSNTTSSAVNITIARFVPKSGVKYVANGCPSGGSASTYSLLYGKTGVTARDIGEGQEITGDGTEFSCYITIGANYSLPSAGITFKPMVCTKAAFGVSPKFVPYKTTFDNSITKVANWLTSFSVPATTGTIKYLYIRGGNPTKMGVYVLANTGIITELASASFASFTITYNSNTNVFDCTSSITVEAFLQTYPIP